MQQSPEIDQLAPAFLSAQSKIKNAAKNGVNPRFQNRPYSTRDDVLGVAKGALIDNDISFTQSADIVGETVVVRTRFIHKSGQWIEASVPFKPDLTNPQAVGSVVTYGSRYGLVAALGIEGEEDDDGNAVSPPPGERPAYQQRPPAQSPPRQQQQAPPRPQGQPSGGGSYGNLPRSGGALFAWAKKMEEEHKVGLVKYIDNWAKLQDFPRQFKDWDADQIALGVAEAVRKLDSIQPSQPPAQQGDDGEDLPF